MSTSLQILLTLALVIGGLAAYHVLVDDEGPAAGTEVAPLSGRELADLEARVAALEGRDPVLRGANDTRDLRATLRRLDERVAALEGRRPETSPPAAGTGPESAGTVAEAGAVPEGGDPAAVVPAFSEAQERAIRDLVDGVVRERMTARFAGRVNQALDELGIELTAEQRGKLDATWQMHMETVRETFRSARESGADREQIADQVATLNAKLTRSLAEFLPSGDAEAIGAALTRPPAGPGRGPGGRFPGPPR